MMLRRLAERLSRRRLFRRRLPAEFGRASMYVTPECGLRYWTTPLAKVDPLLLRCADQLISAGDCAWDIGANVGLFTFSAAVKAGPSGSVISVEADTWLVDLLRRTARLRQPVPMAPIDIIPAAADRELGLATFQIAERARASNALAGSGNVPMGGVRETHRLVSITLDWLLEQCRAPQVVKIDVEGAEQRVLQGAQRLLSEVRPILIMEIAPESSAMVGQTLLAREYELFDGAVSADQRRPLPQAPWDLIAAPRENAALLKRVTTAPASVAPPVRQPT